MTDAEKNMPPAGHSTLPDEEDKYSVEDELKTAGAKEGELDSNAGDVYDSGLPVVLRKLQYAEIWLDSKLGVETQGANRLPEEEREPPPLINMFLIWFSFNIHAPSMTLGFLGPELGLSLSDSVAASVVGIVVGALFSSFNATLGPKLGLRMIACSRYSFGMWGSRLCSFLNLITIGGFLVVGLITVGEFLSAASNYSMTIIVGIVLVSAIAYVISIFGYRVVLVFEKYSWIMTAILLLVLLGQAAPNAAPSQPSAGSSLTIAGNFLILLAVNMSNSVGWGTVAADYFVNYPTSISRWKVYAYVYSGLIISITFPVVIGCVVGNVAFSTAEGAANVEAHGFGGAVRDIYHPLGWSRTCLVLLSFSALGNGVAICYSAGLSLQLLGDWFRAIPRFLWSLLFIVVVAVISIAGREHLSSIIQSFVSVIGYWSMAFCIILLLEDRVFRRKGGYDVEVWNTTKKLPWGVAAVFSLVTGYLAGGLPGMAQTWYVGPIAAKFGPTGGDVGMWLVAAITCVTYAVTRPIEKHFTGR